jgi:hypothetical protein
LLVRFIVRAIVSVIHVWVVGVRSEGRASENILGYDFWFIGKY